MFSGFRALLLVLIPLTGCVFEGLAASQEGASRDLVIALSSDIVSFDPTNYRDRTTQIVMKALSDSLTMRNEAQEVVPHLAESWVLIDETTWEFRLRKGVRFHNGAPFTANDVKFTLDRVIHEGGVEGKTSPRRDLLGRLARVEIVDEHTVRLITDRPWPILPLMLSLQEIMPGQYIREAGIDRYLRHPVGTGPFSFQKYQKGTMLSLVPNPDYFGEKPTRTDTFQRLVFLIEPSKVNQIVMVKRKQCDIILNVAAGSISILEKTPGVRIVKTKPTRSYFAEINCTRAPFNDIRVRQAFNMGLDIQSIIDNTLYGHGRSVPCIVLPDSFAFHPSLQTFPYEPETAKSLLREAGFPSETVVRIASEEHDRPFANLIAGYMTRLGVKTKLTTVPRIDKASVPADLPWDILVTSWGNTTFDPIDILNPVLKSDGVGNYFGYHHAEVDRLLTVAEATMDAAGRASYYHTVQEIIHREAPFIFGYTADEFHATRDRVVNFTPSTSGIICLGGLSLAGEHE